MTDETTISHRRNLVTIRNLKKIYHTEDGEKVALHDVNLNITKRDIYGIIGLSGAGKSTLVRCINGLERYDGGSMVVDGHEITDLSKKDLRAVRRSIGMIFQSFNLMPSRTVAGNVELALLDSGLGKGERESRVKELLELVDLSEKADSYPNELSGGQKQRVAIARALANNPSILLSDEATSALDVTVQKRVIDLLQNLQENKNLSYVFICHNLALVQQFCDRVIVMKDGRVVEEGIPDEVIQNPREEYTKMLVDSVF